MDVFFLRCSVRAVGIRGLRKLLQKGVLPVAIQRGKEGKKVLAKEKSIRKKRKVWAKFRAGLYLLSVFFLPSLFLF